MSQDVEYASQIVKFCIDEKALTPMQIESFARHAGVARKAWNWALAEYNEFQKAVQEHVREQSLKATDNDIEAAQTLRKDKQWSKIAYKEANARVTEQHPALPTGVSMISTGSRFRAMTKAQTDESWAWWVTEDHGVSKISVNFVFDDLAKTIQRYFTNRPTSKSTKPRKDGMPSGWPRFRSLKQTPPAFAVVGLKSPVVSAHRVKLPGTLGIVRVHDHTKKMARLLAKGAVTESKTVRIYKRGGRWYVAFVLGVPVTKATPTKRMRANGLVGIDQGARKDRKNRLALSDGTFLDAPHFADRARRRVTKASRAMARRRRAMTPGQSASARYTASKLRYGQAMRHASDQRAGYLHEVSALLSSSYVAIGLEDLRVKNMTRSAKGTPDAPGSRVRQKAGLNRTLLDAGFADFVAKMNYKTARSGGRVILVPAAYTSQKCSSCGHTASENRETQAGFRCTSCGYTANADTNAARNIKATAEIMLASERGRA